MPGWNPSWSSGVQTVPAWTCRFAAARNGARRKIFGSCDRSLKRPKAVCFVGITSHSHFTWVNSRKFNCPEFYGNLCEALLCLVDMDSSDTNLETWLCQQGTWYLSVCIYIIYIISMKGYLFHYKTSKIEIKFHTMHAPVEIFPSIIGY